MQFKTLALAAIAVAAVSAQSFEQNACSKCVIGSFTKDTSCTSLTPGQMANLTAGFSSSPVQPLKIAAAIQDPTVRACVCHWAATAFSPDGKGAAGSCFTPTTPAPACNSSQLEEAHNGIKTLEATGMLGCSGVPSSGAQPPASSTGGGAGAAPSNKPSGAIQLNMPYVLSVAALGLAALAGL
ncbi:hypothetical protein BGW39_007460 [Mortierella sp. 14UC]|nr:hypothetical protein BGW39_007460 [Mortierella sp. 14UC]